MDFFSDKKQADTPEDQKQWERPATDDTSKTPKPSKISASIKRATDDNVSENVFVGPPIESLSPTKSQSAKQSNQSSNTVPFNKAETSSNASRPTKVDHTAGLVADNLGKRVKKRPILRGVSLQVKTGEAVGLLGPNGAGKTTCFYIMTGMITADYGKITIDGLDVTEMPMYRRARLGVGYLPQEPSIFRGMTVEDNVRSVLELVEPNREKREIMLNDLLAEFSISHLRQASAMSLSGGERRRVEIARALASQPKFILLDEPFAGVDPIAVSDIRDLVSHLKDRGLGVLITDHNVRETLEIVDRAYILHNGKVLMEGNPHEIVSHRDVRRVYLGESFNL